MSADLSRKWITCWIGNFWSISVACEVTWSVVPWVLFVATQQGYGPPPSYGLTITSEPETPLDEPSAYRRDLYLTTLTRDSWPWRYSNPQLQACERPQTHALDGAATGTDKDIVCQQKLAERRRTEVKSTVLRPYEGGWWNYPNGNKLLTDTFPFILSFFFFLFFLVWPFLPPNVKCRRLLLHLITYTHTHTHTDTHTRYTSSGRGIGPLPDSTRHSWSCRDSHPQSQQASSRRPRPWTARRPGSADAFPL